MDGLAFVERPAAGTPDGLVVLHHGRGSNEHDLIGLADILDPLQRLHFVSVRGPLTVAGWPGRHWYVVRTVGFPDAATFDAATGALADFHDGLWRTSGIGPERTVLGGFSMGSVMSFATGLGRGRPAPAGILGLSGFIPTVDGWNPDWGSRPNTRVLVAHGRNDPVIPFSFAEQARTAVSGGGLNLTSLDSEGAHNIDAAWVSPISEWLKVTLPPARDSE